MKREELKKVLKPLIKECIKEVIFEEGILSTIISEVVKGTSPKHMIYETKQKSRLETDEEVKSRRQNKQNKLQENRKRMLAAIGKGSYNGVDLFEGTSPMAQGAGSSPRGSKALDGMSPKDPGVDIATFPSPGLWKKLAGN